jgi:hypothetical protein
MAWIVANVELLLSVSPATMHGPGNLGLRRTQRAQRKRKNEERERPGEHETSETFRDVGNPHAGKPRHYRACAVNKQGPLTKA